MSKKRKRHSKRWQTRELFISSTLVILVISVVMFCAWLLIFKENDESHITASLEWLEENIWRVESYKEKKNGEYDIYLLEVQPGDEADFDKLVYNFTYAPYSVFNSYYLANGVNCQGMTVHLADWCERHGYEYNVAWTATHTFIFINYDMVWYKFDFDSDGAEMTEVPLAEVQKGFVRNEYS